jgi:hypothetical protein
MIMKHTIFLLALVLVMALSSTGCAKTEVSAINTDVTTDHGRTETAEESSNAPSETGTKTPETEDALGIATTPGVSTMTVGDYPDSWETDEFVTLKEFNRLIAEQNSPFIGREGEPLWVINSGDVEVSLETTGQGDNTSYGIGVLVSLPHIGSPAVKTWSSTSYKYDTEKGISVALAKKLWNAVALAEEAEADTDMAIVLSCAFSGEYQSIRDVPPDFIP